MSIIGVYEEVSAALARHDLEAARAVLARAEMRSRCGDLGAFEEAQLRLVAARVCAAEGDYANSIVLASAAIECASGLPNRPEVARLTVQARLDMADAYVGSGDYEAGGELLNEAVAVARRALGEADPDTASAWNSLGMWHRYRGDVDAALDAYAHARQILERHGSSDDLASVLHNEASLAHFSGDLAAAEDLIQRAMSLRGESLGRAEDLGVLAVVLADDDRFDEAQRTYDETREALVQCSGPACPALVFLSGNEAALSYRRGRLAEAEARYDKVLAASETLLGVDHPYTGEVLANLAALHEATENARAAHACAERAIAILSASVEESHPSLRLARDVHDATSP